MLHVDTMMTFSNTQLYLQRFFRQLNTVQLQTQATHLIVLLSFIVRPVRPSRDGARNIGRPTTSTVPAPGRSDRPDRGGLWVTAPALRPAPPHAPPRAFYTQPFETVAHAAGRACDPSICWLAGRTPGRPTGLAKMRGPVSGWHGWVRGQYSLIGFSNFFSSAYI